jgi:cysteinyl-tRNA synthetase
MIRLYDTLAREKRPFVPLNRERITMYVCGPTVYGRAHIGNARPAVVFDTLARLIRHEFGADSLTYARNVTDVDDKIIAAAEAEGVDPSVITERYERHYVEDMAALGVAPPDIAPHATQEIAPMVAMIARLVELGHAYEAQGHVLFSVPSDPQYGVLSKRDRDAMVAGARVEVAPYKRDPADFVLWKPSEGGVIGWESPWGRGRPGWHIECSAMIERHLGETIDIHGGGLDLIFPHHENEIAQSRCAHGTEVMARYWLHNGFLQVEGQKMSKSLGNFVTIHELLETDKFGGRSWPGEVLRLAMLMTHYREPIDFTVVRLNEAEERLRGWQRVATKAKGTGTVDPSVLEALSDDLGFHRASVAMDVIARKANRGVDTAVECLAATLKFFGFPTDSLIADAEVFDSSRIADAVNARLAALNAKDFAKADEIRAALLAEGIQLMDSKNDAGERVTTWEIKR